MSDFCFLFLVVSPIALLLALNLMKDKNKNAVFYGNHLNFMHKSAAIAKAAKMLDLQSSSNIYFTGETVEKTIEFNRSFNEETLRALTPAANGRINRYNFYELALALDTHLHPKCYWMIHQTRTDMMNKTFVYQSEMRELIYGYFSALAMLGSIEGPAPAAFQRWLELLNPWDDSSDLNRVLALFFVWRRGAWDCKDACHAVANISKFYEEHDVFSLSDWIELMYEIAVKESSARKYGKLENLIAGIESFDTANKKIDDYSDATISVTNIMLFYLRDHFVLCGSSHVLEGKGVF